MINSIKSSSVKNINFTASRRRKQDNAPKDNRREIPSFSRSVPGLQYSQISRTCIDYYNASVIGTLPMPQQPEYQEKSNLISRTARNVSNTYENSRANSYTKSYDAVMPAYNAIKDFRKQISIIAPVRDSAIEDFEYFGKNFAKYHDYLENYNPNYMGQFQPSVQGGDFFGPHSQIYFKQVQKVLPRSREIYLVNKPDSLSINQVTDGFGNFIAAKEIYDFSNGVMLGDAALLPDDSLQVAHIDILEPGNCALQYGRFAKILDKPATINNATILPNGDFKADSMVVYDYDDYGRLISAKTYLKPEVKYGGNRHNSYNMQEFTIKAKYSYVTYFDPNAKGRREFLINPFESFENETLYINAGGALVSLQNGLNAFYRDYSRGEGKIRFAEKRYVNLSDIK